MSASTLPGGTQKTSEIGCKCNISLVFFTLVMQKQTMGAMENWTVIQSPVVSETSVSKIIKI